VLTDGKNGHKETIGWVVLIEIPQKLPFKNVQDEFFSIASHELRTPLTSIKGNASMIMDFYKDALKDPNLKRWSMISILVPRSY